MMANLTRQDPYYEDCRTLVCLFVECDPWNCLFRVLTESSLSMTSEALSDTFSAKGAEKAHRERRMFVKQSNTKGK